MVTSDSSLHFGCQFPYIHLPHVSHDKCDICPHLHCRIVLFECILLALMGTCLEGDSLQWLWCPCCVAVVVWVIVRCDRPQYYTLMTLVLLCLSCVTVFSNLAPVEVCVKAPIPVTWCGNCPVPISLYFPAQRQKIILIFSVNFICENGHNTRSCVTGS